MVRFLGQEELEERGIWVVFNRLEEIWVMDREAWRAVVHGVAKSWTPLSD